MLGSGTLGGTGIVSGPVTVNGALAPGGSNTVGTLTISNNLVFTAGTTLSYSLGASNRSVTVISGNLTLAGTLNVTNAGGFVTGTYHCSLTAGR